MIWKRNIENDEVRQYLLGNLPESARERLERRVLNEAEISEELLATEDQLIDQYIGNKLDAQERQRFESYFLLPRERQKKLQFGRTLRTYLDSLPAVTRSKNRSNLAHFSWLAQRPIFVGSFVLAICLGLLGAFWVMRNIRTGTTVTGKTLAIALTPGSSRAEGEKTQRIDAPVTYGSVEVQLEMGTSEYTSYQVELWRERQSITTYTSLHAQKKDGRFVLPLIIAANVLEPGDYTFKLSGTTNAGLTEYKDQYQLRVTASR
jgi:hypothetical protein